MFSKNPLSFAMTFMACLIMGLTSGCASGGWQLTRSFATWINSNGTIMRVVLYILTFVVFFVTILIDVVVNNSIDFWNGTVAQGLYNFERDGKTYNVHHEILPDTHLKRSTIRVVDSRAKLLQEVVLKQTPSGEIELYVDGKLRTRVRNISKAPIASFFDGKGHKLEERTLPLDTKVVIN